MVIAMTIVNVGLSHRFAPAEMLEKLAMPSAEAGEVLTRLHAVPSVDEVAVLCTCNRVEVYAAVSGARPGRPNRPGRPDTPGPSRAWWPPGGGSRSATSYG